MKSLTSAGTISTGNSVDSRYSATHLLWFGVMLSAAVCLTCFHYGMASPWRLAAPQLMADFEAAAPFQYRVLFPAVVAGLHAALPLGVELLFALIEIATWMVLVVVAHRALVAFEVGGSEPVRRLLAITIIIPVAVHLILPDLKVLSAFVVEDGIVKLGQWRTVKLFRYVYDLPAAVFTLALVLLLWRFVRTLEGRWFAAYLGLFALATLNRETTLFMIPAFLAVCYPVLQRSTLAWALALQVAVFAAIQGGVQWLFADNLNPHASVLGTQYENHLAHNLALFANPLYLIVYFARFGAGLYLPILVLYRHLDPFLGRTILWYGLPLAGSVLLFGRVVEHRVIIEIVPLIWLGAMQAIAAWSRHESPVAGLEPVAGLKAARAIKPAHGAPITGRP